MVVTEQYFPRGGKKPKVGFNDRKKFDFLGNSDKIGKKKRYRPKIIQKDRENEDLDHLSDVSYEEDDGKIKSLSAEKLTNKTLQEGMIILGRISEVSSTKLKVTLPNRLYGFIMASHISSSYTKQLQSFVNDEVESIKQLDEIFKVGEYISVKIISLTMKNDKMIPVLSMMPEDINAGFSFSRLREGDIVRGAIESVEDHGYVIDMGVSNCRTFLPLKLAEDVNLAIGQVIWCVVKKANMSNTNSILTVSNKVENLNTSCISGARVQRYTVHDLRPGMAINFFVNKPLSDGAEGNVLSDSVGYVHTLQIESRLHTGKTVKVYMLYAMPVTNLPFFTTREIFKTLYPDIEEEKQYKEGQIIENAKVSRVTSTVVIFKFENGIGIMPKRLSQHKEYENLYDYYKTGSEHDIRIVFYHFSDYAYVCSDDEEVLQKKYFTINDISIGDFIEGTVKNISNHGVVVQINSLRGWIPNLHLNDVGLYEPAKPGSKSKNIIMNKFKIGEKISTRVWKVNADKNVFHLTAKPSLLSTEFKLLSSYEEAKVGSQYKGIVECYFKGGLLVKFFNDVKAFVAKNELCHEDIKNIQDVFNLGQIVNCTILSVNLDEKKMTGSLIRSEVLNEESVEDSESKAKKNKKKSKKRTQSIDDEASPPKKISKSSEKSVKPDETSTQNEGESILNIDAKGQKEQKEKSKTKSKQNKKQKLDCEEENVKEPVLTKKAKKKKLAKSVDNEEKEVENVAISSKDQKDKKKKKKEANEGFEVTTEDTKNKSKSKRANSVETINDESAVKAKKSKKTKTKNAEEKDSQKSGSQFSGIKSFWDLDASTISKNIKNAGDTQSSDSDDEIPEESLKKKKKRLTNAEKIQKARTEEDKLRGIERELMEADSQPKSSDQFDRLLLANPSNSELWIAYMAFHLQATEIDRARAVAKKAINTISFREEQEKMNVWIALLNLENRFGTKESLNSTLQDAVQMNESFIIHSKMLEMYVETGKVAELTSLIDTMLAKYKNNPETYTSTGEACYKLNLTDKARAVMQKAISRLDNKKHVPVLIKFAQLENSIGNSERAETLFEQIVGCMPSRTDVWCVYVDSLLKSNKIDNARLILERAVSQKLPARKMKVLFKKWIEMEERSGDSAKIEQVRQMALEYVEKNVQ